MRKQQTPVRPLPKKSGAGLHRPTKILLAFLGVLFFGALVHFSRGSSGDLAVLPSGSTWQPIVDGISTNPISVLPAEKEETGQGLRGTIPPVTANEPVPPPVQEVPQPSIHDTSLLDAVQNRPGGATEYDRQWAKLRALHVKEYAGITRYPDENGVEAFTKPNLGIWELFRKPEDEWVARARAVIDAARGELSAPDDPTLSGEVTMVTTLLDLKRASLGNFGQFKRSMEEYYARFNYILDRGFKMVVFMPYEFKEHLHIKDDRVTIVHFQSSDIQNYFPYYDRVQEVRTSPLWKAQADHVGWLAKSPQASLPGYDPLVMSKVMLLRDAEAMNPYRTKYFLFVDSGHMCAGAQDPEFMNVYTEHMDRGYLVTHWPYGTNSEVHGFTDKAMHEYVGTSNDPLRIVRGGVFGAKHQYVDVVTKVYDIVLAQTLSDGYMGTEENILAIIFARFPELFAGYDNNQWGEHGDNCAIFNHQSRIRKEKLGLPK